MAQQTALKQSENLAYPLWDSRFVVVSMTALDRKSRRAANLFKYLVRRLEERESRTPFVIEVNQRSE